MVGRQEDKQKNRQGTNTWLCVLHNAMFEYFKRRPGKKKLVETRNCKDKAEAFVSPNTQTISWPCDVFINHRGIDTKRNIAGLLYDHLSRLRLKPFMDSRNMKPGDKLRDQIHSAIRNCKVAVVVFSPNYCDSYHCLRELALLMESKKRVLPIFWDVEPSKLRVKSNGYQFSAKQLWRFRRALEKVKDIVGLTFNPFTGDWSEFLKNASDAIEKLLEEERRSMKRSKSLEQYRLVYPSWPTPVAKGWNHAPQKFDRLFQP